ncbi:MAG: SDR family oxidoreductase [Deltaproteobacteria bacterium]|jgi:UDP-glucose 4-epimerase|nr:SDR family oxidoreductase [Deltaproteobacteria bacterium]MBW2533126.1 SDR family oxidoreductase [Deltaproteobacteria bacterium]
MSGSSHQTQPIESVLITGADGYVGRLLVTALANADLRLRRVVATDLRLPPPARRLPGIVYESLDVRSRDAAALMAEHGVDSVIHLAAVVSPGRKPNRELLYDVEVRGTENLLECCLEARVGHFVVTSSGAAYGYHADSPVPLDEEDPLRGNETFAYSHHKRLVEEMLARYRTEHPEIEQLVLRPGTILGRTTHNQITALFEKRAVLGLSGIESPFVLIWDEDVVGAILHGLRGRRQGIYNLAGDGVLTMGEMARLMGKPYVELPSELVEGALYGLHALALSPYGPEQVDFLRYRPVLGNRRLKEELGYLPRKTTREVFDLYLRAKGLDGVARSLDGKGGSRG